MQQILDKASLKPLIDLVITSDQLDVFKPHPAMYQAAVSQLGLEKNQVVYITRSPWDAAGAKAAGYAHVILLTHHLEPPHEFGPHLRPDREITSLTKLADAVRPIQLQSAPSLSPMQRAHSIGN